MISFYSFLFLLLLSFASLGARKSAVLTPYQKAVQECLQGEVDAKKLNSISQIYSYAADTYQLLSSEVLGREVLYKEKGETRKLRFENGKLHLFKILDDEDERSVNLNNEVRQRSLTTEAFLTQLLIHADVRSDWMKSLERRTSGTVVTITISDGEMKSLVIEKTLSKKKLECSRKEGTERCLCTRID